MKFTLILIYFSLTCAFAEEPCAMIDFCHIEKISYGKKGWEKEFSKDMILKELCYKTYNASHALQLEPELGVALQVYSGDPKEQDPIKKLPSVNIDIYSRKLTFVVASARIATSTDHFSFSHRLTPRGKSILQISCFKK
jgi:hypothetical protein